MLGFTAKNKAELDKEINQLMDKINRLQEQPKIQASSTVLTKIQECKLNLDNMLLQKVNDFRHNSNKVDYISANKLISQKSS